MHVNVVVVVDCARYAQSHQSKQRSGSYLDLGLTQPRSALSRAPVFQASGAAQQLPWTCELPSNIHIQLRLYHLATPNVSTLPLILEPVCLYRTSYLSTWLTLK
jgi:hypothetical protein